MAKNKSVSLNVSEIKEFIYHIITNNQKLQESGKKTSAVAIEGGAGIGKTSAILQVAKELGLHYVKLNLSQIEELGDLVGFPIKQFQMCNPEGGCEWIDEPAIESYKLLGYTFTGKNRMSYCPPEWIADKPEGGILLLDDYNRADKY